MAERTKVPALKAGVLKGTVGSNPTSSAVRLTRPPSLELMSKKEPKDKDSKHVEESRRHAASAERDGGAKSGPSLLTPKPIDWGQSDSILGDVRPATSILGDAPLVGLRSDTDEKAHVAIEEPELPRPVAVAERTARWLITAAVFLVPIVFHPETIDAFNLAKVTVLWILLIGATAAWVIGLTIAPKLFVAPRGPMVAGSVALLAVASIATLTSPNRALSFFGLYHRYEGLISIGLYIWSLLLVVLLYRRTPRHLRDLLTAVAAAATVVGVYVLMQGVGLDPFQWRGATGADPSHPVGALGNAAFTASFQGIAAPAIAYMLITARTRVTRMAWLAAGGVVFVSILITQGRGGLLAALAGLGALVMFQANRAAWTKVAAVAVLLFVLGLVPVIAPALVDPAGSDSRVAQRTDIWIASVRTVAERPLLGWGPESFYGQHPPYRTATEAREHGLSLSDKPHNIFLSWATSTGMAGLSLYVLVIGLALFAVGTRSRVGRS